MNLLTRLFILSIVVLTMPLTTMAVNSFPDFPMAFWGTATIDGQSLAVGTKIQTYCDANLVGEVIIQENGIYGYADSTKIKLLVSNCGSDILFKYLLFGSTISLTGASEIKYTDSFQAGITINKNIDFITAQSCNITNGIGKQTWNGSAWSNCTVVSCSSGYHQSGDTCVIDSTGGGGGGIFVPVIPFIPVVPISVSGGDINNDNKVNEYDFAIMMSQWGQTGSGLSADLNNDGEVDEYDFALLMAGWSN